MRWKASCTSCFSMFATLLLAAVVSADKPQVITFHYDQASTGQNLVETELNHVTVKAGPFGKKFAVPVNGQIYAQPLYLPAVEIKGGAHAGRHDVVFVVTQHDSAYAFDADSGTELWTKSFISPPNVTTVPFKDVTPNADVTPEIGITSTPAIDIAAGTLYLTAKTKEIHSGTPHYVYRLHALDIGDGAEKPGSPVVIGESTGDTFADVVSGPTVKGKGEGGNGTLKGTNGIGEGGNGTLVRFNAKKHFQRSGITLTGGHLYLAFSSHGDNSPYHGWVLGFNAKTLALTAAINVTPNAIGTSPSNLAGGGIWQAGGKLPVDSAGFLYLMTGNGIFDETLTGGFPSEGNFGDSFLKLAVDPSSTVNAPHINGWGLKVVDYFTPFNEKALTTADEDVGSGGSLVLPDAAGSHADPHLLVGTGKEGRVYLLNRDNLGKFNQSTDHVVQESPSAPAAVGGVWGNPAYFRDHLGVQRIYFGGQNDHIKAFTIANGKIAFPASSQTTDTFSYPGATPSISANKDEDPILWAMDARRSMLRAFSATDLSKEMYNSGQVPADALPGQVTKFTTPTIADGKVFVVSQGAAPSGNHLVAYGLKQPVSTGLKSYQEVQQLIVSTLKANNEPFNQAPHKDFWATLSYDEFVTGNVPNVQDPNTGKPMPILVKGDSSKSNLILALRGAKGTLFDPDTGAIGRMPANGPPYFTAAQINAIAGWIDAGCPQ
jgi:outer membrane protein assembly factor BamB